MKDIVIIGGGIVGLAVAYKLSTNKNLNVTVLEKENEVGKHQSTNNSGVLHCGLYYKPGNTTENTNGVLLRHIFYELGDSWAMRHWAPILILFWLFSDHFNLHFFLYSLFVSGSSNGR